MAQRREIAEALQDLTLLPRMNPAGRDAAIARHWEAGTWHSEQWTAARIDPAAAGLIETTWVDGPTDGLGAMIGAWWCNAEARRLGVPMGDLPLMVGIGTYNGVDVRVMADVVRYLRGQSLAMAPDYEHLRSSLDDVAAMVE